MLTDVRGRTLSLSSKPQRVVSLVPSLTESLFDLGAGNDVVGVTDYCIFPPSLDRPRVGGTKNPDVEAIRALAPDLVHMNLEENLERHAEQIERFAPVFVSEPKSVDDVAALIESLGVIHDCQAAACDAIDELQHARIAARGPSYTFACPIWKKPWMWCGGDTYVSNLVESTGGVNVLRERTRYPALDVGEVLSMRPSVVFLPDEPYAFTADDARDLRTRSDATIEGPFPGHLFTWHGTRTILGLRFLGERARAS